MMPLQRVALLDVSERLVRDHPDLAAGSVLRSVARCRAQLVLLGVHEGLAEAVEESVRTRLRGRT